MKLVGVLALLIISSHPTWGLGRVKFGGEFTFWNPKAGVIQDPDPAKRIPPGRERVVQRMRTHLIDNQPEGAKFAETAPRRAHHNSIGRFESPNGWWFEWGHDDSVIEINTIPEDVEYFERYKDHMQDAIFVSAANEGFFPALYLGGGHINLGMSAFEGNNLLLRNFVVDHLLNHNELFLGIFNYDTNNAASIFVQTESVRNKVRAVVRAFDRGEFADTTEGQHDFLRAIQRAMDSETDACFIKWETGGTRRCYFGLNFYHHDAGEESRIEFRGVRAQADMQTWVNQIRLIRARLLYLEKIDRPIPIRPLVPVQTLDFTKPADHLLNPPVEPRQALAAFHQYVTESGEKWEDHRSYVWPAWLWNGDLERFENGDRTLQSAPTQKTKKKRMRSKKRGHCEELLNRES